MIHDPLEVARLARLHATEDREFRTFLQHARGWTDGRLNRLALRLGRAAEAGMDCTKCGACCRQMVVPLSDAEVTALASRLSLPVLEFRAAHVTAANDDSQTIDAEPCPFLRSNQCDVYDARPQPCRDFPYLEGDVRGRLLDILDRVAVCPIVFEQWQQLKKATGFSDMVTHTTTRPRPAVI